MLGLRRDDLIFGLTTAAVALVVWGGWNLTQWLAEFF